MSDRCDVASVPNRKKIEQMEKNIFDLSKVMKLVDAEKKNFYNIQVDEDGEQGIAKVLFGERFKSLDRLTDQELSAAHKITKNMVKFIYQAMDDPFKAIQTLEKDSMIRNMLIKTHRLAKVDTSLERFWWGMLKKVGVDPSKDLWTDFFGVRLNKFEQWGPARRAFFLKDQVENLGQRVAILSDRSRELTLKTARESSLIEAGIDSFDKVNELAPFFDKQRQKDIMNLYGMETKEDAFRAFAKRKGIDISSDDLSSVFSVFDSFVNRFNIINYGFSDIGDKSNEELYREAKSDSIIGYIRSTGEILGEMYSLMENSRMDRSSLEVFDRALKRFTNFKARKDYIPLNGLDEDALDMFKDFKNIDESESIRVASWLGRRPLQDSEDSLPNGNFIDSLVENLSVTSLMSKEFANRFFYQYLEAKVIEDSRWFEGSPERDTVKTAVQQATEIVKRSVHNERNDMSMYGLYNLYAAAVLGFPSSAIRNTISGKLNMFWRMGDELGKKDFDVALQNNDPLALAVNKFGLERLMSIGMVSQYTENPGQELKDLTSAIKDFESMGKKLSATNMKIADFLADGGILRSFKFWRENFSMKTTEERLRHNAVYLLYNRINNEFCSKGIVNPSEETITETINKYAENVFYDMNNALGNFSTENRPFLMRAMGETTENRFALMVGTVANWTYLFRHAGHITLQNFMHSFSDTAMDFKMKTGDPFDTKLTIQKGAVHGALMTGMAVGIYEILKETVFRDTDWFPAIGTSITKSINPFEEVEALPKLALIGVAKAFNNGGFTDEEWDFFKGEMIQQGLGVLAGQGKFSIDNLKSAEDVHELFEKMYNLPKAMYSLFTTESFMFSTPSSKLYQMKQTERERMDDLLVLSQIDPVFFVAKMANMLTIRSDDPIVNAQFVTDVGTRLMMSMFGINFWNEKKRDPSIYYNDHEFTSNTVFRYQSVLEKFGNTPYYNKNIAMAATDYMLRYGRARRPSVGRLEIK